MFAESVALLQQPIDGGAPTIATQLQEGRRYLDVEVGTLFSRYGLGAQEWTVVGTVGYHAAAHSADFRAVDLTVDGTVSRAQTLTLINTFLRFTQTLGLSGGVQAPGFTLVPLAVYRRIPGSALLALREREAQKRQSREDGALAPPAVGSASEASRLDLV